MRARHRQMLWYRKCILAFVAQSVTKALVLLCGSVAAFAEPSQPPLSPTNIFAPVSTPAQSIFDLSVFVLIVTAAIFVVVFSLLVYAVLKFRRRASDGQEPAQVYGSV